MEKKVRTLFLTSLGEFSLLLTSFYGVISFLCLFDHFVSLCCNLGISICKEKVRCIFVLSLASAVYLPCLVKDVFQTSDHDHVPDDGVYDALLQAGGNVGVVGP